MNIRPSDLPLLVSLDALLELKNVTHAAQRLHMSQPALSSQLARLRVLFKDPLLMPSDTGRGMVATPRADQLASPLREAIGKLSLLGKDSAFDPATSSASPDRSRCRCDRHLGCGIGRVDPGPGQSKDAFGVRACEFRHAPGRVRKRRAGSADRSRASGSRRCACAVYATNATCWCSAVAIRAVPRR